MVRLIPIGLILLAVVLSGCSGDDDSDVAPTSDQQVLSQVTDALIQLHQWDRESVRITLTTVVDGKYASGDVGDVPGPGGGLWFAALVDNQWKIVWDGNGAIDCPSLAPYPDFPASLIGECYNPSDGSITRRDGSGPVPTKAGGEVLTITASAANVALSAKVITLEEETSGITTVAITDETAITFADGRTAQLRDIEPGSRIEASGSMGTPGSLLAEKIVIQ